MRGPLLEAVLEALRRRGHPEAWAAYRADWEPVLAFFHDHRFAQSRTMINYIAELARIPHEPVPEGLVLRPMNRGDLPRVVELGRGLFAGDDIGALESFYWENP